MLTKIKPQVSGESCILTILKYVHKFFSTPSIKGWELCVYPRSGWNCVTVETNWDSVWLPRLGYKGWHNFPLWYSCAWIPELSCEKPDFSEALILWVNPYSPTEALRLHKEGESSVQPLLPQPPTVPLLHTDYYHHLRDPLPDLLAEPFQDFWPRETRRNNKMVVNVTMFQGNILHSNS